MTIHADDIYREKAEVKAVEQVASWLSTIQQAIVDVASRENIITKELEESMIRAIFGSNQIERAGLNLEITVQLCRKVLAGEDTTFSERDPTYHDQLLELYTKQSGLKSQSAQYILRSRNEVVQHAKAFQHLIHAFVVEKKQLSEDLIKEIHRMLVKGVPLVEEGFDDVNPEDYGGIYRNVIVGAGTTNFTVPRFVPEQMKRMCSALERELAEAEERGTIDPFSIATKYSLEFVQIHPFRDGNGRMCRLILNAILCRYLGIIVPIGEQGEDREEYMGIKRRASQNMDGHGEYASFILQKGKTRVREMKKKLMGKKS